MGVVLSSGEHEGAPPEFLSRGSSAIEHTNQSKGLSRRRVDLQVARTYLEAKSIITSAIQPSQLPSAYCREEQCLQIILMIHSKAWKLASIGCSLSLQILPHHEKAIVPIEKLRDYVLNPNHPHGKNKARVFKAALGMEQGHADVLAKIFISSLFRSPAVRGLKNPFGEY